MVCCDGTSNDVTGDSTNVLRLFRSLIRSDQQLTYYDPGVGTVSDPTANVMFSKWLSRNMDMGMGFSIRKNVCNVYGFLARYYRPGDDIYLFGFSRGAYIARAVAGMIHFLGLIRPEQTGIEPHAWSLYANDDSKLTDKDRFQSAHRFRATFSLKERPNIHFIGAWDTVSSFGWFWNLRTLPYTSDNPSIANVYHAVAIDERRAMFQPNRFRPSVSNHDSFEEVWFAGGHGDVGGGWPEPVSGLSKITLQWMCDAAFTKGLLIESKLLDRFLGKTQSNDNKYVPASCLAPVNSALQGIWWLIEFLPRRQWDHKAKRQRWVRPHLARRRRIAEDAIIHPSVYEKIRADITYNPVGLPPSIGMTRNQS